MLDDDQGEPVADFLRDAHSAVSTAVAVLHEVTRVARAVEGAALEAAVATARVLIESAYGHAGDSIERVAHRATCDALVIARAGVEAADKALSHVEHAAGKLYRRETAVQLDQGATRH